MASELFYEKLLNTAQWFEFLITDSTGSPVTGSVLTVKYRKEGAFTLTTKSYDNTDTLAYKEVGNGHNMVKFSAAECDTSGYMLLTGAPTGAVTNQCTVFANITKNAFGKVINRVLDYLEGEVEYDKVNNKKKNYKSDGTTLINTRDIFDDETSSGLNNAVIIDL